MCQCSKSETHVALSSGHADLNSAVEGISQGTGVHNAAKDILSEGRSTIRCVDARACKAMVLRAGTGKGATPEYQTPPGPGGHAESRRGSVESASR